MALALQTVTPRARGRVVQGTASSSDHARRLNDSHTSTRSNFLRLDLEDLPLPSFHRPDLENYWFHRLLNSSWLAKILTDEDDRVRAVICSPIDANGDSQWRFDLATGRQITAIKRKISLRPLREDHPHFDGSNRRVAADRLSSRIVRMVDNGHIAIPYWEAVGPWDVDNDNDGVPDSVWVDLGDPVAQAEDGTLYKPLYAFLVVDLDSRLNVNAHGLVDDLQPANLDATLGPTGSGMEIWQHDLAGAVSALGTSNVMPQGMGYGPAEISLRPHFITAVAGTTLVVAHCRLPTSATRG